MSTIQMWSDVAFFSTRVGDVFDEKFLVPAINAARYPKTYVGHTFNPRMTAIGDLRPNAAESPSIDAMNIMLSGKYQNLLTCGINELKEHVFTVLGCRIYHPDSPHLRGGVEIR